VNAAIEEINDRLSCVRIDASLLMADQLADHYSELIVWMLNSTEEELAARFCPEVSWFREVVQELQRRDLLEVN
jgi:hypothetical protein